MINLSLLTSNVLLIDQFQDSVTKIMSEYCQIQYRISLIEFKSFEAITLDLPINDFNILFFDETIDKTILRSLSEKRPDIYLIVFSHKKEIPFYYDYHIFSSLPYTDNHNKYSKLLKNIISIYNSKPIKKVHFISNKMILLFDYDQIIQLHFKNHKLILTTIDGQYQVNGSLKNYIYLVNNYNFLLISRSKIINPKHKKITFR